MLMRLASTFDPVGAADLRSLVDEGLAAARGGDSSAFLDLDRRFHLGLLTLAGNPRIVDVVDQVLDQLRLAAFHASADGGRLVHVATGHQEILEAIEAGDAAEVERAARAHPALTRSAWATGGGLTRAG